ncbi:MAG: DUF4177 domain-containing protein [Verrucomicrobiota bacterium]
MKWEYRTVKVQTSGLTGGKVDTDELSDHLNLLGSQGWELVSAFDTNYGNGGTRDVVLIFKRQK